MLTLHPQRAVLQIPQTSPPPRLGGDASQAVHPRESDLIRKDRLVPLSLYIPRGRRSDGNSYKTILVYYFFKMFRDELDPSNPIHRD